MAVVEAGRLDDDEFGVVGQAGIAPLVGEVVVAPEEQLPVVQHVHGLDRFARHLEGVAEPDIAGEWIAVKEPRGLVAASKATLGIE